MFTQEDIWRIAREQSAIDSNCKPEDFTGGVNRVVTSAPNPRARIYLDLPFGCDLTSYGGNIVASVAPGLEEPLAHYINSRIVSSCFETPDIYALNDLLLPHNLRIQFMAQYFLPDLSRLAPRPCLLEMRLLEPKDFAPYYSHQYSNALCEKRPDADQLALGAFDGDVLAGLAGCSADCDAMWQIGVDVLPDYRGRGIASAITAALAQQVLARGKVPFYCAAWSNVISRKNALGSGFSPAWVQMTAKPLEQSP